MATGVVVGVETWAGMRHQTPAIGVTVGAAVTLTVVLGIGSPWSLAARTATPDAGDDVAST
jgi:hypothetical protein